MAGRNTKHTFACGHIPKTVPATFVSKLDPLSIAVIPATHFSVVVFPPPFGTSKNVTDPFLSSRSSRSTATFGDIRTTPPLKRPIPRALPIISLRKSCTANRDIARSINGSESPFDALEQAFYTVCCGTVGDDLEDKEDDVEIAVEGFLGEIAAGELGGVWGWDGGEGERFENVFSVGDV